MDQRSIAQSHSGKERTNDFDTEKILTSRNAAGDREAHKTFVGNKFVDCPLAPVKTILVDLEPLETSNVGLSCVGHLGTGDTTERLEPKIISCHRDLQVSHDRPLVRGVDGVLRISRTSTGERMVPFGCHLGTSGDWDDCFRDGLLVRVDTTVANHIIGGDIGDGLFEVSLCGSKR